MLIRFASRQAKRRRPLRQARKVEAMHHPKSQHGYEPMRALALVLGTLYLLAAICNLAAA